jgi:hypothetical protein
MKKSWTMGLEDDQKHDIEEAYKNSSLIRDRITQLLKAKIQEQDKKGRSEELYDSPNWELRQADINGFNRALDYVISLIK